MKTIKAFPGDSISSVAAKAVQMVIDGGSSVSFEFNGIPLTATPGKSAGDICAEYDAALVEQRKAYMAPEKVAERERQAKAEEEKRQCDFRALVVFVKTADEKALRESKEPWPYNEEELTTYIAALAERQHDYGTCVYAMSLSAVAAFNYVAHKLGTTGFQSSCADMDILRRTRHIKGAFRLVDYENLLYPQYLNEEHFPSLSTLLYENRVELAKQAQAKIDECKGAASPRVIAHWKGLVAAGDAK